MRPYLAFLAFLALPLPSLAQRPNIIFILVDDLDVGLFQYAQSLGSKTFPKTSKPTEALTLGTPNISKLSEVGMNFSRHFSHTPVCAPARAILNTGQTPQENGIYAVNQPSSQKGETEAYFSTLDKNGNPALFQNSLPVWLESAGYFTFFAGKEINGYDGKTLLPGYKESFRLIGASTYDLNDYSLLAHSLFLPAFSNPQTLTPSQYQTEYLADRCVDFIERNATNPSPLFMWVAPVAPHVENKTASINKNKNTDDYSRLVSPASKYYQFLNGKSGDGEIEVPLDFLSKGRQSLKGKNLTPEKENADPAITRRSDLEKQFKYRLAAYLSVDEMVGRIVDALKRTGRFSEDREHPAQTVIVFMADNGLMYGHYNLTGKSSPELESALVPAIYVTPETVSRTNQGKTFDTTSAIASNLDFVKTITEIAGISPGRTLSGRSLGPILQTGAVPSDWRKSYVCEGFKGSKTQNTEEVSTIFQNNSKTWQSLYADPSHLFSSADPSQITVYREGLLTPGPVQFVEAFKEADTEQTQNLWPHGVTLDTQLKTIESIQNQAQAKGEARILYEQEPGGPVTGSRMTGCLIIYPVEDPNDSNKESSFAACLSEKAKAASKTGTTFYFLDQNNSKKRFSRQRPFWVDTQIQNESDCMFRSQIVADECGVDDPKQRIFAQYIVNDEIVSQSEYYQGIINQRRLESILPRALQSSKPQMESKEAKVQTTSSKTPVQVTSLLPAAGTLRVIFRETQTAKSKPIAERESAIKTLFESKKIEINPKPNQELSNFNPSRSRPSLTSVSPPASKTALEPDKAIGYKGINPSLHQFVIKREQRTVQILDFSGGETGVVFLSKAHPTEADAKQSEAYFSMQIQRACEKKLYLSLTFELTSENWSQGSCIEKFLLRTGENASCK